ncbi:MAG: 16S rRNA (cytidine(1402)-2'-O)-methyltransferase [Firmicutes bacterium]|nr:16S rRNA (cytidine(1402)-2'-O)-methyltransferase [Bacillota bacterium]
MNDDGGLGLLYLVGTPIGNLEDLSPRALAVLRSVSVIAAEDTRRTLKLLNHFGIKTKMVSYHRYNEAERLPELLALLAEGRSVALVSDAGMPGISDPGERLVRAAREAGFPVTPIPGPSAFLLALAASGLPTGDFRFISFLPRGAKERRASLDRIAGETGTTVLYEAPHRLARTLAELRDALGGEREVVVARELTKVHEEFWRGSLAEAAARYGVNPVKGEITLVIAGRGKEARAAPSFTDGLARVGKLVEEGTGLMAAVRRVAKETGLSKNALYRRYLAEKTSSQKD